MTVVTERHRRFLKTSAVYFAGSAMAKLATLLLLPIYTSVLDTRSYGEFDFWSNLISFAAPIAFFQVWDATYRYHFREETNADRVVTNGGLLMAWGLLAYVLIVTPLVWWGATRDAGWILGLGLALCLQYFYGYLARSELRNGLFVLSGVLNTVASGGVSLVALLVFDLGATSLYLGMIAGHGCQVLVLHGALRPHRHLRRDAVDRELQVQMLQFSLPLCLSSAGYWMLAGLTRLEIVYLLGASANGLFAVAVRLSSVVATVSAVFLYAWNELLYTASEDEDRTLAQTQGSALALKTTLLGASVTMMMAALLFDVLVDETFRAAYSLVPLAILGVAFNSVATFVGSIFMERVRTGWLLLTTALAAAVNLVAGLLFTSLWGVFGAVGALALAFLALLLVRIVLVSRMFGVRVVDASVSGPLAIAALAVGVFYFAKSSALVAVGVTLVAVVYAAVTVRRGHHMR